MTILLDTHALIWWVTGDRRLSSVASDQIRNPENVVLASSASAWEIATKHRLGRLDYVGWDPRSLRDALESDGIQILPIDFQHALDAGALPGPHRDPFDRILIAQSRAENAAVATRDPVFGDYEVEVIW